MTGLTVGIRYLMGFSCAPDCTDRDRSEWPPHPARVFMAMAAAHFETGGDAAETQALEWLESLPPPILHVSRAEPRSVAECYVPINDKAIGKGASDSALPRTRQPRTFPAMTPEVDTFFLCWPDAEPSDHANAVECLCRKTVRVGLSSAPVQVWVAKSIPDESGLTQWIPTGEDAGITLRVTYPGLLEQLKDDYRRGQRPSIGSWNGYRQVGALHDPRKRGSIWNPQLIIRRLAPLESRHHRLSLLSTLQVCQRLRDSLISQSMQPVPEFISGHSLDGSPTDQPHIACFPLAFVGNQHATGQLLGVGIALPTNLTRQLRMQALAALGQVEQQGLALGRLGKWRLECNCSAVNLQPEIWSAAPRGSRCWASVTPVAFDRHPKGGGQHDDPFSRMIMLACERVGLPAPREVIPSHISPHPGVPVSHQFPPLSRKDGSCRRHAHAILIFAEPVLGPIAIGAGRYRGYGFFRPYSPSEAIQ
jgi:CRISPR-associated protein Csb2